MNNFTASEAKNIDYFIEEINEKVDQIVQYFMFSYFFFGIFLAFFHDIWLVAISVGGICLLSYFLTKNMLPESGFYRYVASAVLAVFMAQFIYQMHGMFEMHLFAFLGAVILIAYQNWRLHCLCSSL